MSVVALSYEGHLTELNSTLITPAKRDSNEPSL